jgi:hypothetical protein
MNNPLGRKYILKCQAVSGAIFNFREIVDRMLKPMNRKNAIKTQENIIRKPQNQFKIKSFYNICYLRKWFCAYICGSNFNCGGKIYKRNLLILVRINAAHSPV